MSTILISATLLVIIANSIVKSRTIKSLLEIVEIQSERIDLLNKRIDMLEQKVK